MINMIMLDFAYFQENACLWIALIVAVLGLIGTICKLVPTLINFKKAIVELIKNKDWKRILSLAMKAMKTAELSKKSGADKKAMVIGMVSDSCSELGIELDIDTINKLSKYIDDTVGFVNEMNKAKVK